MESTDLQCFFLGSIGALAPEIIRLYKLRKKNRYTFSKWYFVISAVYAALGGVVAWAFPFHTRFISLGAGVAVPAIITLAGKLAAKQIRSYWSDRHDGGGGGYRLEMLIMTPRQAPLPVLVEHAIALVE